MSLQYFSLSFDMQFLQVLYTVRCENMLFEIKGKLSIMCYTIVYKMIFVQLREEKERKAISLKYRVI